MESDAAGSNAPITLASASPRRLKLIKQMRLPVRTFPVDIEESFTDDDPAEDARRIAEEKLGAFLRLYDTGSHPWIVTADTVVTLDGKKIGKPRNKEHARATLAALSGRTHRVITGIAFNSVRRGMTAAHAVTDVVFAALSTEEIEWYLSLGEWEGAAGGYKIQGTGGCFIVKIDGSYSNVMGLPIRLFYGMLKSHNYPFDWS